MNIDFKQSALAVMVAAIFSLPVSGASAQGARQERAPPPAGAMASADLSRLYRDGWSAEEMLDAEVRSENGERIGDVKDIVVDRHGNVSRLIVEVGGFLELGDQHIGVPWKDLAFGRDLEWIQVPLRVVKSGEFSLYGRTPAPQGESVPTDDESWRVNELIGDQAQLLDARRYGIVSDVIFDSRGRAQAIVVRRGAGVWGAPGRYAYPYAGYYPAQFAYPLPYKSGELASFGEFDYVRLGEESLYSGAGWRGASAGATARDRR